MAQGREQLSSYTACQDFEMGCLVGRELPTPVGVEQRRTLPSLWKAFEWQSKVVMQRRQPGFQKEPFWNSQRRIQLSLSIYSDRRLSLRLTDPLSESVSFKSV